MSSGARKSEEKHHFFGSFGGMSCIFDCEFGQISL